MNKEIGTFMISTIFSLPDPFDESSVSTPTSMNGTAGSGLGLEAFPVQPAVIAECLNSIYDIYADKDFDYDEVFVKYGFLKYLMRSVIKVRSLVKKIDKRKYLSVRENLEEAQLNLNAFIKYKEKERDA